MYLLYVDESGNPEGPDDRYFVLGGVAIFERQTFFVSQKLDMVQTNHFPGLPPIEFHTEAIRSGKGFWRRVERSRKAAVLGEISMVIENAIRPGLVLFAVAVHKDAQLYGEAAVRVATEYLCRRFDTFLMRRFHEADDPQRGMLVFAEGRFHQRSRLWVQEFRQLGTQWGVLRNLSDIPYFASPKETRLLQLADFVAHAVYLLYENRDATLIRPILPRFEERDGIIHGLVHVSNNKPGCECPICASRRTPHSNGAWLAESVEVSVEVEETPRPSE
jgi:Protein of unknown function (DUF3800)